MKVSQNIPEKVEIHDSEYKEFISFTTILVTPVIGLLIFFSLYGAGKLSLFEAILCFILILSFVVLLILLYFGSKHWYLVRSTFVISDKNIEVFGNRRSRVILDWNGLKLIKAYKVKYYAVSHPITGYKLEFSGSNLFKEISLFSYAFHKKKTHLILKELEKFSKDFNIDFIRVPLNKKLPPLYDF